jgi:hypothetical protein
MLVVKFFFIGSNNHPLVLTKYMQSLTNGNLH